jgi:hypothetical protein
MSRVYSQDELEEKYRWMRERQRIKHAIAAGREAPARALTPPAQRRREQRKELPAHLEMYRVREVAEMLGVSTQSVLRWFADSAVVVRPSASGPRRPKRVMLISRAVLEAWMREHATTLSG